MLNKTTRTTLVAVLCLLGSACASTTSMPLNAPSANETTVYFIRQHAEPSAWNLNVSIDGTKVASVANRSYVAFSAPSGTHALALTWPLLAGGADVSGNVTLAAGQAQYFVMSGRVAVGGHTADGTIVNSSLQVREIAPAAGKALIESLAAK